MMANKDKKGNLVNVTRNLIRSAETLRKRLLRLKERTMYQL